jgi:thermostable 8-oxoguanine DNA glycosylase
MKTRSDNAIMEKRVRMVQQWLLEDHPTSDIVSFCISKWNVSKRQAYRYLSHAMEKFKEANEKSVEQKVNYYLARKRSLYTICRMHTRKLPRALLLSTMC